MVNNEVISNIIQYGPELVTKWLAVAGLVMYTIFAIVVIKQSSIMAETFESEVNSVVKLFAWLHLAMAAFLVFVSIVWL